MTLSKRLTAITHFLTTQDAFVDIGTDHAYVPILMAKRGSTKILATDIHENALGIAKKNIVDAGCERVIQTKLSDGLDHISLDGYDTLVIAGMGYFTIKHILENKEKLGSIKKIILQSNNHLKDLRIFMNRLSYALVDEVVLWDAGHYYTIMKYEQGTQTLTDVEYAYGLYREENKAYYQFLAQELENLLKKVHTEKANTLKKDRELLETYL